MKEKKIAVQKLESLQEAKTCKNCSSAVLLDENVGVCEKRLTVVSNANVFRCPVLSPGESRRATLDDIARYYAIFKELEEEARRNKDVLRDLLIQNVQGEINTENFKIRVQKVLSRRLNVEKARKFLKEIGRLEDFLTAQEYYRVEVTRKLGE